MRRFIIFAILLLAASVFGCTIDKSQIKNKQSLPMESRAGVRVDNEDKKIQTKDEIPFILGISKYNDTKTEVVEEQVLLCYWNVKTGSISIGEKSSPKGRFANDARFKKIGDITTVANGDGTVRAFTKFTHDVPIKGGIVQQGEVFIETQKTKNTVEKPKFRPPLPNKASGPHLLLAYGNYTDFNLLAGYDDYSKDGVPSGLLIGNFDGSNMKWKKIKGSCLSLVAAYTPDVIKVDNRIFIDAKTRSTVKVIDLNNDQLEVVDYAPVNKLINEFIDQIRDINDVVEIAPPSFGLHQNMLLVTIGVNYKTWAWALQDDRCVSKICINSREKKLTSYKDDNIVSEKIFSEEPSYIWLPRREPSR